MCNHDQLIKHYVTPELLIPVSAALLVAATAITVTSGNGATNKELTFGTLVNRLRNNDS